MGNYDWSPDLQHFLGDWITPKRAIAMRGGQSQLAKEYLLNRLRIGVIRAVARHGPKSMANKEIADLVAVPSAYFESFAPFSEHQFWEIGDAKFAIGGTTGYGDWKVVTYVGVRLHPALGEEKAAAASIALNSFPVQRAIPYKAGRPPSDEAIIAKAHEMHERGMTSLEIARDMRRESGFENAGNVHVRELIRGIFPRTGRPKRKSS